MKILKDIFESVFIALLCIGGHFCVYTVFYGCLSDDVDFHFGKTRMRNRRKKFKGFWKKFFFIDIKDEVVKWHYALFWINFCSFGPTLIFANAFALTESEKVKTALFIFGGIYFLSALPIGFVRWRLYKWNQVRSRKSYRKNK